MSDWTLKTPVAFFIFNRPETTERVFAEIARAKPPKLLVIADGARENRPEEAARCAAVRAIVKKVDWECEVYRNYSEINLGCKHRVASGLDWVFDQVTEAIILEDDCLPHPTFFRFCEELLEYHRNDQQIGMIGGVNFQFGRTKERESYYFSKYTHIWGWASWRDRWHGIYDVNMARWPEIRDGGQLENFVWDKNETGYWRKIFERVYLGNIDTWDYQWLFANWLKKRLCVLPAVNLISNIGFGADTTHRMSARNLANLPVTAMLFPLTHPITRARNVIADHFSDRHCIRRPLWKRIYGAFVSDFL